jgi:hypothetical protein
MEQRMNKTISSLKNEINQISQKVSSVQTGKKKNNRRARRQKGRGSNNTQKIESFRPRNSGGQMISSIGTDTGLRRLRVTPRSGLSDQGIAFLKCAFAPPDFQANSVSGVPDEFTGPSLTKKHRYVNSFPFSANNDYYFLLLPTPGVAFWALAVPANTLVTESDIWRPIIYADAVGMFGTTTGTAANQVQKFRYVSNHFELIPTVNQMTWSGSISVFKLPMAVSVRQGGSGVWTVTGLTGINGNQSSQYSGPFIMGTYTAAYNANGTFPFSTVLEGVGRVPQDIEAGIDFGQLRQTDEGMPFVGFDNQFESIVIKVSGVTVDETALFKTWACVEYQCSPNSSLYSFTTLSPEDLLAMDLYRKIINGLPIGVPFEDNESFWNRVLSIISQISGFGSFLPGPYGMAARGVNLLSNAGLSLMR